MIVLRATVNYGSPFGALTRRAEKVPKPISGIISQPYVPKNEEQRLGEAQ